MIAGTADLQSLAQDAPSPSDLDAASLTIADAQVLKVSHEIAYEASQSLLPPALHPTMPPYVTWLFVTGSADPFGQFAIAQLQIGCRAGVVARGFVLRTFADNAGAGQMFTERWGITTRPAEIQLHRQYDGVFASVTLDDRRILDIAARDALVLSANDVSFNTMMPLARTSRGLRLLNIDLETVVHQAERLKPALSCFEAAAWGDARIRPTHPISATALLGDVTFSRLRYVCDPAVPVTEGTEAL